VQFIFLQKRFGVFQERILRKNFYRMTQLLIELETGCNCIKILVVPPDKDNEISGYVARSEEKNIYKILVGKSYKTTQDVNRKAIRMQFWIGP
jgi:hypothetical protein